MEKEAAKFLAWYEAEKAKDLVDIKFFACPSNEPSQEKFFEELNEIVFLIQEDREEEPGDVF